MHDVVDLERAGWHALSTGGGAAAAFYERTLADDVTFLLPGGMVLRDRAAVISSLQGPPWTSYELRDEHVLPLGADAATLTYRVRATRDGAVYEALVNSTYVRDAGSWKLALHQQTPA
jgi:hypothetical protein